MRSGFYENISPRAFRGDTGNCGAGRMPDFNAQCRRLSPSHRPTGYPIQLGAGLVSSSRPSMKITR